MLLQKVIPRDEISNQTVSGLDCIFHCSQMLIISFTYDHQYSDLARESDI